MTNPPSNPDPTTTPDTGADPSASVPVTSGAPPGSPPSAPRAQEQQGQEPQGQDAAQRAAQATNQAVAEGGAYEVLRRRLISLGQQVQAVADDLNARRLKEFGDSKLALLGRVRIRTEHNGVGRDIVQVPDGAGGSLLLFGFNVFMGLKTQTRTEDVFGLYRLVQLSGGYDVEPVSQDGTFLADPTFLRDFEELYAYYKHARLLQVVVRDQKLLAAFQIGERSTDMRVFRWSLPSQGAPSYIDARGERDIALPRPFDFEWQRAGRDLEVSGRFPHLNILDTLFVECSGGDLTIKIENNTETGRGIYSEAVEDRTQALDDAQFEYARVGSLILLKVLPYREKVWRGLIYNTVTRRVVRLDAITQACVQLPEDHGIIFPGGYYLQNGEHKAFEAQMQGMQFKRARRSPNGEDVLYVFYEHEGGEAALFVYNMIQRQVQTPVFAHGYALIPDGRMVLFHMDTPEPTRVHQMQVWQTPFTSDEYAASRPPSTTFLGRLGNAELVRGLSNLYSLAREIEHPDVSAQRYSLLTGQTRRLFDLHHWFDDEHLGGLRGILQEITATGESVLDEFEKVQSIRAASEQAMQAARSEHRKLLGRLQPEAWTTVQEYVDALNALSAQRGHLLTIREARYIDVQAIDTMAGELDAAHTRIGAATGAFLAGEQALAPLAAGLQTLEAGAAQADTTKALAEQLQAMSKLSGDLDLLSELMTTLKVDDAAQRTRVVEAISGIYARLNQARARAEAKRKTLGSAEVVAQFGAQFALFGQGVTSALSLSTTPEKADEQLARLMVGLEEIEGQFGEHEQFLSDILAKREELLEVFDTHKQALLDERQRRAQAVQDAAGRILSGLPARTERLSTPEELNAFFAGDPLIQKLRELAGRLRELKDPVKADDIEARLSAARDQAVRAARDRAELYEGGGSVIRLGPRHKFSVNTQPLDLTLLPRGDELALHLTGTDYMQPIDHPALRDLRPFWQATLESESPEVYRAEYLAGQVMQAAELGQEGLSTAELHRLLAQPAELARKVREFAAPRYREGYERGIHDHDAALILQRLLPLTQAAGSLVYPPAARALAALFWADLGKSATMTASPHTPESSVPESSVPESSVPESSPPSHPAQADWISTLSSAHAMQRLFGTTDALHAAHSALAGAVGDFLHRQGIAHTPDQTAQAAAFLAQELRDTDPAADPTTGPMAGPALSFTQAAADLLAALETRLRDAGLWDSVQRGLERQADDLAGQWETLLRWLGALAQPREDQSREAQSQETQSQELAALARFVPEAAALKLCAGRLRVRLRQVALSVRVDGLLGEHPRISGGSLVLGVDETLARLEAHRQRFVPQFGRYQAARQEVMAQEREALRLDEFRARPLTSFVRNRLINDIYLPIIGDNLAKQMGTVGEGKRSDLMGLLLLISPPGYGKTTLMEYVAHRLGLVFMKISGPALGHGVRSLDPAQAPDATSRQELEKLNLALEMGNNVMLYIDDIQHTHPEFLQKFISLTDGTRRIEGVWKGNTKTYDLRGRKVAVVMAGNPYTESGEVFKVPDMLANRADIYNLGDVLGGMEDAFLLSYLENSLTSNPVLAPLATRDLGDLYLLADKAQGKEVSTNALSHPYSEAEVNEIVATLRHLMAVRDVLYRVNGAYIASAAQDDRYRTEPPFKLQGSYRNMNKLAEKVSAVMNDAELEALITDHYLGEAQLLTSGTEENLLKLAELRGTLTPEQAARWAQIKADFKRHRAMGGDETDTGQRMVAQLADIASGLQHLGSVQNQPAQVPEALPDALRATLAPALSELAGGLHRLGAAQVSAEQQNLHELSAALKQSLGLVAEMAAQRQAPQAPQAPPGAPNLSALPDTLSATLNPLLSALADAHARQAQVNDAIRELAEVIRKRQTPAGGFVRARTEAAGRHERE